MAVHDLAPDFITFDEQDAECTSDYQGALSTCDTHMRPVVGAVVGYNPYPEAVALELARQTVNMGPQYALLGDHMLASTFED